MSLNIFLCVVEEGLFDVRVTRSSGPPQHIPSETIAGVYSNVQYPEAFVLLVGDCSVQQLITVSNRGNP